MLKILRQGQRWVTALFVLAIGGVFIFYLGIGGGGRRSTPGVVVEVGEQAYGVGEFRRVRAQRESMLQEQLGEQYDSRKFRDTLDQIAVQSLVETAILAEEAQALGLSVSKAEIERFVLEIPAFRDGMGRFDPERYESWVQYEYGNQSNFIRNQSSSMLTNKFLRTLTPLFEPSEGETRGAVIYRLEAIELSFVTIDPSVPVEGFEPDPAAVEAALTDRELEIRSLYGERSSIYNMPEQVRASHILLKVAPDASEEETEATRAKAQQILERLQGGEDFAHLAGEVSDDPGSKELGGDLGFFGRGQMVAEFEEAAFSREPGELGELIKSDFGFHILRVEESRDAVSRSYEDVREELATELLAREAGRDRIRLVAESVAEAIRGGSSLEEAAGAQGLSLEASGRLQRRPDGFIPGLGAATDLMNAAFGMEAGQTSDRVFDVDGKLVLFQLVERFPPDHTTISAVIDQERTRIRDQKRVGYITTWINQRRTELIANGELIINLDAVRGG